MSSPSLKTIFIVRNLTKPIRLKHSAIEKKNNLNLIFVKIFSKKKQNTDFGKISSANELYF